MTAEGREQRTEGGASRAGARARCRRATSRRGWAEGVGRLARRARGPSRPPPCARAPTWVEPLGPALLPSDALEPRLARARFCLRPQSKQRDLLLQKIVDRAGMPYEPGVDSEVVARVWLGRAKASGVSHTGERRGAVRAAQAQGCGAATDAGRRSADAFGVSRVGRAAAGAALARRLEVGRAGGALAPTGTASRVAACTAVAAAGVEMEIVEEEEEEDAGSPSRQRGGHGAAAAASPPVDVSAAVGPAPGAALANGQHGAAPQEGSAGGAPRLAQ